MKIAVMGAGAVGCYFGAKLALAGHTVTLIARPHHVDAILRDGLILEMAAGRQTVALAATSEPEAVAAADLVLFCVKSTDTIAAGAEIAPYLSHSCAIWSLQNGVDNAERLQARLDRPVTPAVVYVAAEMAGPGHVKHHGRGELVVGPAPGNRAIAEDFIAAGIPVELSENVATALWAKLVVNCAYNAISAISQLTYGTVIAQPGVVPVMRDIIDECLTVAKGLGVSLPDDIGETVPGIAAAMPGQYSSTAQDLARGRTSEIDHLNGYIVRKGDELGLSVAANRVLHTLVKLLEHRTALSTG